MPPLEYEQLVCELKDALAGDAQASFAIIGHTAFTYDLLAFFEASCSSHRLRGVYGPAGEPSKLRFGQEVKPLADLEADAPSYVIIASDDRKEELLEDTLGYGQLHACYGCSRRHPGARSCGRSDCFRSLHWQKPLSLHAGRADRSKKPFEG